MTIVDYKDEYCESVKDLLVELQEYIANIDREGYNILTDEFRENAFKATMEEVSQNEGKIFLAKEENKIVGMIIGIIDKESDDFSFRGPKRGIILELIVSKNSRSKGTGNLLLETMENYLKSVGCKNILIEVFAYNQIAKDFYTKKGYFSRCYEMIKLI